MKNKIGQSPCEKPAEEIITQESLTRFSRILDEFEKSLGSHEKQIEALETIYYKI